eukprot:evm.model.NODE_18202_length_11457_cov_28.556341.1
MAGTNEERYKVAMANAVKTIKSQKEHIADLESKLAATEERVEELEDTLEAHGLPVPGKRKRADRDDDDDDNRAMDVEGSGGGGEGGSGNKKAKAATKPPTVCQSLPLCFCVYDLSV